MNMPLLPAVVQLLTTKRVPFALVGAGAMAAHGIARSTFDIDLLTTDPTVLATTFWRPVAEVGARIDVRKGDADDPLVGVVRLAIEAERTLDIVVGRPGWQDDVLGRAQPITVETITFPVVTVADLIALKLYAGGAQDAWDIEQLLAGSDRRAICRSVDELVPRLPDRARAMWQRLRGAD